MKTIILKEFGGVENLETIEIATPEPSSNEVLIKVSAISINPVDVKTRVGKGVAGMLKDVMYIILGWDISGVVVESRSPLFQAGDEVFGMVNFPGHGKAYAEYVLAPADQIAVKPANITFESAAASSLAGLTVWQAMVNKAKVKPGQKVLIHAAAGGVGHLAVQLAKHLGAYVIGTSSAANKDFVMSLGADEHIDYRSLRFEDVLSNIDFVLDTIGGENIDRSLNVIKKGGTVISIPSDLNAEVAEKAKAMGINGYSFLVQSNGSEMQQIAGLLAQGILKPYISTIFTFEQMADAHLQLESGRTRGKVVVKL